MENKLLSLAGQYPVVTITGSRQSGKTTVSTKCFPEHLYLSLEDPDVREHARRDPRGFLTQSERMIIGEVQHVPDLVSYIQGIVDRGARAGQFILTGSHHFSLTDMVSQSLAGRTALVNLLPFSLDFYKRLNPDNKKSILVYTDRKKTNRCGHECLPFWSV